MTEPDVESLACVTECFLVFNVKVLWRTLRPIQREERREFYRHGQGEAACTGYTFYYKWLVMINMVNLFFLKSFVDWDEAMGIQ